jgi:glycine/D-amino acid oxidase-like deaminating enzyme
VVVTGQAVTGIDLDKRTGTVRAVRTATTEYPCDAVVVAAGAKSGELAAMAGLRLGNDNSHGATVVTEPLGASLFASICAMHTPRDLPGALLNMRQFPDGRVQIHGGTHSGSIADESLDDAQMLVAETARWLPAVEGKKVDEVRVTTRPVPPDGLPVLGFAKAVPNYYVAFTHSGATLAPIIGELAATEILETVRVELLAPYRLERFG